MLSIYERFKFEFKMYSNKKAITKLINGDVKYLLFLKQLFYTNFNVHVYLIKLK